MFAPTLALLLLFAACGDDDGPIVINATENTARTQDATPDGDADGDPTAVASDLDACALLTREEIEDALGSPVPEGDPGNFPPFFGCSWMTEDFNFIDISVTTGDGGQSLFDFNNDGSERIDGLGDRAQYLTGAIPLLEVLDGNYYLSVSVNSFDLEDEEARETAVSLAELALGRLP